MSTMYANAPKVSEMPEIKAMRYKTLLRIAMMFVLAIFVALSALHRTKLIRIDAFGTVGTVALIAAVVSVGYLAFDRDSYLPFLGECVVPPSLLSAKTPQDSTFTVTVNVPVGATHVMYWASESGAGIVPNPYDAYGNYSNAGIVKASTSGTAILPLRCPSTYSVRGRQLPRHVHYRAVHKSGVLGSVQTTNVTCL